MIKAAFFDIDGTLLSFRTHRLSQGTIKAIQQLRERKILTFICSGRAKVLIPPMPVSFDGVISVNGGYCQVGRDVIYKNPLHHDDSMSWLQYAEQHNYVSMAFTEHEMFANHIDDKARALRDQLEFQLPPIRPSSELMNDDVYQFIAMIPPELDNEILQFLPHSRLPRWHPDFSDLIPVDSSKAIGMQQVLNWFDINRNDTIAFGDGGNDIEMLQFAGIGVAMGNASDTVKANADFVTTDVDNEGIFTALQNLNIL